MTLHEEWVVRYYGDGDVSYHSFEGPALDPRFAHRKTRQVAGQVAVPVKPPWSWKPGDS